MQRTYVILYVIGDVSSPKDFHLDNCNFFSIARQHETGFVTAGTVPRTSLLTRKNIGYLQAIRDAQPSSLRPMTTTRHYRILANRSSAVTVPCVSHSGWVNVYRYFTDENIGPEGCR